MEEKNPKTKKVKIASAAEVARMYWRTLRGYPWLIALILAAVVILQIADLAAPLYLRQFFNLLATGTPGDETVGALTMTLGLVAAMWALDWAAQRTQGLATEHLEVRAMEKLYNSSFRYLLDHSYNFFISNFAGALTHKMSRYARAFETLFDAVMSQFFPTFLFVGGAIAVLFTRNQALGFILAGWTVAFLIFQIYLSRQRQPIRTARAEADTRLTGALADAVSNHITILLFSGATHERNRLGEAVGNWRTATLRSWVSDGWVWAALGFFMMIIQVALLYGAIIYWRQGLLTVGDFVLIQAYLLTTFNRLIGINFQLRRFYDALADAGEMAAILKQPHEVPDRPGAQALAARTADIAFKNVDFYFNSNRPILEQFELRIPDGQKVALVGPSGAGKSTITKLLLRLFDVKGGAIEIGGQNIADITQDSLRETIAFVPQEPILFHRTLMENIRYGRRDATDEEVVEAAKQAHCHEFITALPEQYETYVGERGIKLSGGERQRVAIARAILKNAPILLLDEATSSLDSESEHLIQDALETLMEGKTVIVIAHRLSTIMKMDRIIVLERGRIAAEGTHADLLKQGGLYHKLWSIQAGGFLANDEEPSPEEAELEEEEEYDEERQPA